MSRHAFEVSLIEGRHNEMAKWVGEWQGTTRVWLEPGKLGDEAPTLDPPRPVQLGADEAASQAAQRVGA